MLGANPDATITFRDEIAAFRNTLGVVLVGADGSLGPARIVFANVEHADAIPQFPFARPGGGPLSPGDEVRLSQLYTDGELVEGQQFAFFSIADGFRLNGNLTGAELVFLNADGSPADDRRSVRRRCSHGCPTARLCRSAATSSIPRRRRVEEPLENVLNDGGRGQVLSGLVDDAAGLTITFEDKTLNLGDTDADNDFNDVTYDVLLEPGTASSLDFVDLNLAVDASVADDDASSPACPPRSSAAASPATRCGSICRPAARSAWSRTARAAASCSPASRRSRTYVDVLRSVQLDADDKACARSRSPSPTRAARESDAGGGSRQPHHRGRPGRRPGRRHPGWRARRRRLHCRPARRRSAVRPVG